MIPAGAEERLRGHVEAVLTAANVPARDRDELAEELVGHLIERCGSLIAEGMQPTLAAERAIAEFGPAAHIGRELTWTYRGRIYASTIGPLLPDRTRPSRPVTVTLFAVQAFAMSALYAGMAGWSLLNHAPLHALLFGIGASAVSAALLVVGFGLLQAQRWAAAIAVVGSGAILIDGIIGITESTIRLNAILAAASLVALAFERGRVLGWLVRTRTPRRAATALGLVLMLPLATPAVAAVPDPTQATPADLDLKLTLDCDASTEVDAMNAQGERTTSVEPAIVIRVDITWRRTSLFPNGVADQLPDNVVVRLPDEWVLMDDRLFDVHTGSEVPGSGGLGPGGPSEVGGSTWFAAIPRDEIRAGRTIRFEVTMADTWIGPRDLSAPTEPISVHYWHADRFTVERSAICGGSL